FMTIAGFFGLILASCISDAVTASSSANLSFSRDTVNFDTVFTDLGTPTARLIVFNHNKKGVEISSKKLKNQNSNFSINVDGRSGKVFNDVEIRGNDSIYVFIECFIPETEAAEPALVDDELIFVTNGVTQSVRLEAYGQNITRLRAQRVSSDMTLTAERPIVVFDSLVVEEGATLKILPDTKLLFHDGAQLIVHGRLDAIGEPGKFIQMRGDRLDNVLPNVGYDILAGQWKGIRISQNSFDNRMEYVDMRSTEEGLRLDSCADLSKSKLLLRNSWLHNSQGSVLESKYAKVDAYGCCFSEAADAVVSLTGGVHQFVQCTFANNYLFSAISQPILSLYHLLPDHTNENDLPLMKASFENSIIYGLAADINEGDLYGSDVFFRYVSLKSEGTDDENFINCMWDTDPLFLTDRPIYYFNYHVRPDSPVIGMGDPIFVNQETLYDMDGVNRLADGYPTLGAYARPEERPESIK
ncbi:MAG: hypothetical protein K2L89_01000, partial [Muribaculaceae bacterium]|nr:hypothetical protein [Muribaculaceae bacterium]